MYNVACIQAVTMTGLFASCISLMNSNCNSNYKYDKLYSTVGGKPLLGCFTKTFTVSAISNTRDYRSSTVSTVF